MGVHPTFTQIYEQTKQVLDDLWQHAPLSADGLLVLGVSTSEVIGRQIGTGGNEQAAASIFQAVEEHRAKHGFHVAYQCCEHINRSLLVEERTARQFRLQEVTVIPVAEAGGSMAAYAYGRLEYPVMVEHVRADAGIDIGDTLIGMHLKHVAVPVRPDQKQIGHAHVTLARTRPKLIGGARAVYTQSETDRRRR